MAIEIALVICATGSQGKGAVRYLVATGWTINALVSSPEFAYAQALKNFGASIKLYKGTLCDHIALGVAMKDANAVFLNQMPSVTNDSESESPDATTLLDAVKEAGVQHIAHLKTLALSDLDVLTKFVG